MASLASSLLPLPSYPAFQPRRKNSTKTRSSSLVHKWVILNSLHSSAFPLGSDPPDPQTKFPIVFSYLGALRSPVLNDPLIDVDQDSIQLPFMGGGLCLDPPGKAIDRVFVDDPPWILPNYASNLPNFDHVMSLKSLNLKRMERSKYNKLRRRQIKAETEAWAREAEEYKELEREMLEKKLAPSLPYVKSLFLGWFEPLRDAIEAEQRLQTNKRHKAAYAGHIGLLPADKMAVIVMHKMMGLLMMGQEEGCVRVVQAAVHIGEAIEQEVSAAGFWRLA